MADKETKAKIGYLKVSGVKCLNPDCQSEDIEGIGEPEIDFDGCYSLEVICNTCGSTWTDIYALDDVRDINIKNKRG